MSSRALREEAKPDYAQCRPKASPLRHEEGRMPYLQHHRGGINKITPGTFSRMPHSPIESTSSLLLYQCSTPTLLMHRTTNVSSKPRCQIPTILALYAAVATLLQCPITSTVKRHLQAGGLCPRVCHALSSRPLHPLVATNGVAYWGTRARLDHQVIRRP
jgi:hypothetical protein